MANQAGLLVGRVSPGRNIARAAVAGWVRCGRHIFMEPEQPKELALVRQYLEPEEV